MLMQDWLAQLGSTSIYLNPRCVIRRLVFAATLLYPFTRIIILERPYGECPDRGIDGRADSLLSRQRRTELTSEGRLAGSAFVPKSIKAPEWAKKKNKG